MAPYNKNRPLPELLAPAGSPAAFRAAVSAGADAVYISGKKYGARQYALNFTRKEIAEAVSYAHARGIRLYVTVNTLVHDRELHDVGEYLLWLYSIGVDAVLLQDIGVGALARTIVPDLPLHASTQMTIHNADGVRWAAEQGFSRVVLARELSLQEVERIAGDVKDTKVGLEVFAHGAICYCYSGQCLLSSLIGGRSGNRGMCAQPCRKPYKLMCGDQDQYGRPLKMQVLPFPGRFLLSPKDLCTYPRLNRLVTSPIVALKIEGRLKSPEYVAIVIATYRRALDTIAQGNEWIPQNSDVRNLMLAFNRGFTTGYLFSERYERLMGRDRPDNRGLLFGRVTGYNAQTGEVTIQPDITAGLVRGDGVLFCDRRHPEVRFGFFINSTPRMERDRVTIAVSRQVHPGSLVYLTSSKALTVEAHRIIKKPPPSTRRPLPIDLFVRVDDDGIARFDGTVDIGSGRRLNISHTSPVHLQPARTLPLTAGQFKARLQKTGGTPYFIRNLRLNYRGGLFAPVAELNHMRREFLAEVQETLVTALRPTDNMMEQVRTRWEMVAGQLTPPPLVQAEPRQRNASLSVYADSLDMVMAAAAAGCSAIYFEPTFRFNPSATGCKTLPGSAETEIETALDFCHKSASRLVWKLPKITKTTDLDTACALLSGLNRKGLDACMVESTGAACAMRRSVPGIQLFGGPGLNIFNHRTHLLLSPLFTCLTLSQELSGPEIEELIRQTRISSRSSGLELIVQGNAEVVISEDCLLKPSFGRQAGRRTNPVRCPFFGIRDNTGRVFPVHVDSACRTHVSNAVETCLIDHIPLLVQAGIDSVAIDARGRTTAYTDEMVNIYRNALDIAHQDVHNYGSRSMELKDRIKQIALGGITSGHFVKGLQEP